MFFWIDIGLVLLLTVYVFAALEMGSERGNYGWYFFVIAAGYVGTCSGMPNVTLRRS